MSDFELITFGCAVTFIGAAGAYIYMREVWLASHKQASRVRATEGIKTAVRHSTSGSA